MEISIDTNSKSFHFGSDVDSERGIYLVAFARQDNEDAHYWGGNEAFHAGAINQLRIELQEAFDAGHIAGHFNIVGRVWKGGFILSEEAVAATGPYRIVVRGEDGDDITSRFTNVQSIDGWCPGSKSQRARPDHPIGTFNGLSEEEARIVLSQLIDQGREHGPTDEVAEVLYQLIEPTLRSEGFIATPDGWTIKVVRTDR